MYPLFPAGIIMRTFKDYSFLAIFFQFVGLSVSTAVVPFCRDLWTFFADSLAIGFFIGTIHTGLKWKSNFVPVNLRINLIFTQASIF